MPDQKIEVIAYSGYRDEGTPRAFILQNEKIEVVEILDMWIEESFVNKVRKRFFKIKGSYGYIHKIYCIQSLLFNAFRKDDI
jgi:hypothetical protein